MLVKFKDYLCELNEEKVRDFSFDNWLAEARARHPEIRAAIKAMPKQDVLSKAELIMELVKQKLFNHFPMWRPFWSKMPPIPSFGAGSVDQDGFGTMCTTGTAIFYCPYFVAETYEMGKIDFKSQFKDGVVPNAGIAVKDGRRHPMDYSLFVIIHEILHCSLKHHLRQPTYKSEYLTPRELAYYWNIAADYEINHLLLADVKSNLYEMVPFGVRADEGGFVVPEKDRDFFMNENAETIYYRLVENIEEKRRKKAEEEAEKSKEKEEKGEPGEPEKEEGEDQGEKGEPEKEEGEDQQEPSPSDQGEPGEGGEGEGDGGDSEGESPLKPGDVIYDRETGEYGIVSNVEGEDIDFEPISEEEARKRLQK